MDCSPLNLAHFHERRADKFLRHHRYEDAEKAVKASLLYLQDAYKNCTIPKSIEVLDTQKWEYERKLRQIQMRRQQHERLKLKEIVPLSETNSVLLRPENSVTAQSVAKSIDKTIREFDAKFTSSIVEQDMQPSKENQDPREGDQTEGSNTRQGGGGMTMTEQTSFLAHQDNKKTMAQRTNVDLLDDDMPSLTPLELPSFDYHVFSASTSTLASIVGLAGSLQK